MAAAEPPMLPSSQQDAEREASRILTTHSLAEATAIQARAREQLQYHAAKLRDMVGAKYRTLIECADNILEMLDAVEAAKGRVESASALVGSIPAEAPALARLQSDAGQEPLTEGGAGSSVALQLDFVEFARDSAWIFVKGDCLIHAAWLVACADHLVSSLRGSADQLPGVPEASVRALLDDAMCSLEAARAEGIRRARLCASSPSAESRDRLEALASLIIANGTSGAECLDLVLNGSLAGLRGLEAEEALALAPRCLRTVLIDVHAAFADDDLESILSAWRVPLAKGSFSPATRAPLRTGVLEALWQAVGARMAGVRSSAAVQATPPRLAVPSDRASAMSDVTPRVASWWVAAKAAASERVREALDTVDTAEGLATAARTLWAEWTAGDEGAVAAWRRAANEMVPGALDAWAEFGGRLVVDRVAVVAGAAFGRVVDESALVEDLRRRAEELCAEPAAFESAIDDSGAAWSQAGAIVRALSEASTQALEAMGSLAALMSPEEGAPPLDSLVGTFGRCLAAVPSRVASSAVKLASGGVEGPVGAEACMLANSVCARAAEDGLGVKQLLVDSGCESLWADAVASLRDAAARAQQLWARDVGAAAGRLLEERGLYAEGGTTYDCSALFQAVELSAEETVQAPLAPSGAVYAALARASARCLRAHTLGHVVDSNGEAALRASTWEALFAAIEGAARRRAAAEPAADTAGARLNESFAAQAMFDLQLLGCCLVSGGDEGGARGALRARACTCAAHAGGGPWLNPAALGTRKRHAEETVSGLMDPIDWAVLSPVVACAASSFAWQARSLIAGMGVQPPKEGGTVRTASPAKRGGRVLTAPRSAPSFPPVGVPVRAGE